MVYSFLSDTSLWSKIPGVNPELASNQGAGYPTAYILNYFKTLQVVSDERPSRLDILTDKASGQMNLYTDSDRYPNAVNPFSGVTVPEFNKLFNVIEQAMFQVGTIEEIDAVLIDSASDFGGYLAGSFNMSSSSVALDVTSIAGTISDTPVKNWISFEFALNGVSTPIKIWLGEDAFKVDYPFCTITKIIMPAEPSTFLTMSDYANIVDAIAQSATYANLQMATDVQGYDHNGLYGFITRYCDSNLLSDYNFSFGVLYKGVPPTTTQARVAVREAILATGLAPEETWKVIFPDLWITGRFYIVPNWDNFKVLPTKTIYPSIADYEKLKEDMVLIFNTYNEETLLNEMEIMKNSGTNMLLSVIPSELNDPTERSLQEQHPTYLAVDATTQVWDDQDLETREFNQILSNAIGTLLGGQNTTGFSTTVENGRNWLTFASNYMEYLVLERAYHPGIATP